MDEFATPQAQFLQAFWHAGSSKGSVINCFAIGDVHNNIGWSRKPHYDDLSNCYYAGVATNARAIYGGGPSGGVYESCYYDDAVNSDWGEEEYRTRN
jgi:hypothetical protein